MTQYIAELKDAVRDKKVILFVGAGLSKNIGLPTFSELIDEVAKKMGYDADLFKSFSNFQSLVEFYQIKQKSIGELRSYMDQKWHNPNIHIEKSEIHKLIVDLDFPIIYTTNYDYWLEKAFEYYNKSFTKIVNVKDFADIQDGTTQIVKFHGDFSDDSSIVLTESSYFERLDFSSPLDIKLRSDMLGKTILFIGYSLEDINMRFLIYKLNKIWENYKEYRPKSFIFLIKPNEIEETVLKSRGIMPIISESDTPTEGLKLFLQSLPR
ncbi:SIR2 family protein [uncultured Bacteroides sp.]|uniref:SIR2 family protein n=1 Tax=uncultured Bacteroides sp. TaxID=162156 RepID=UPI0025E8D54D|nr:SIR2 family protein [uncultured Bacteroides sp.]